LLLFYPFLLNWLFLKTKSLNNSMTFHTKMEEKIKWLFFNETLRRWHFEDIVVESGMSRRERVNYFLKSLTKLKLILRILPKGKMPYYIANKDSAKFRYEKRIYGLHYLEKAGFFELVGTQGWVQIAILFGSFAMGTWNKDSDIDLFVYGKGRFDLAPVEHKLNRDISLFRYDTPSALSRELDPNLIPNIIKGFHIKGNPFGVLIHA